MSIVKPCFWIVSSKSMVAPSRYGTLILSTTTSTTVEVDGRVAVEHALVEVELVDQARATAGLHGNAQAQVVATLLLEQAANLGGGGLSESDAVLWRGLAMVSVMMSCRSCFGPPEGSEIVPVATVKPDVPGVTRGGRLRRVG